MPETCILAGVAFLILAGVALFVALRVAKQWYWRGLALVLSLLFLAAASPFLLDATLSEHSMETTAECFTADGTPIPCPSVTPRPGVPTPSSP
jgi:hypothetical protein